MLPKEEWWWGIFAPRRIRPKSMCPARPQGPRRARLLLGQRRSPCCGCIALEGSWREVSGSSSFHPTPRYPAVALRHGLRESPRRARLPRGQRRTPCRGRILPEGSWRGISGSSSLRPTPRYQLAPLRRGNSLRRGRPRSEPRRRPTSDPSRPEEGLSPETSASKWIRSTPRYP